MAIISMFPQGGGASPPPIVDPDVFDKVIRTQAEFELMIASTNWLGATSVCFVGDGGNLKFTRSDGKGCLIPQSVKQIQGVDNAIIEVTKFVHKEPLSKAALSYQILPTSSEYSIRDMTVYCIGVANVSAFGFCTQLINCVGYSDGGTVKVFSGCTNLVNCKASVLSASGYGHCFHSCSRLTNCAGTSILPEVGHALPFDSCDQLISCIGVASSGSPRGWSATVFGQCNQLTSCTGSATAVSASSTVFSNCTQIDCCTASSKGSGAVSAYAFNNCRYVTGCEGTAISETSNASSFERCVQISNCKGEATGSNKGISFSSCTQLANCTGTGTSTDPTGIGYSFYDCHYLNGCRQGAASTTAFLGGRNTKIDNATVVAT